MNKNLSLARKGQKGISWFICSYQLWFIYITMVIAANNKETFIKIQKYNKHLNMSGFYLPWREASTLYRDFCRENIKRDEKETMSFSFFASHLIFYGLNIFMVFLVCTFSRAWQGGKLVNRRLYF